MFAPQKGATPAQVELLRRRLERLAQVYRSEHGVDVTELEGAGAAGGLAGGLAAAGARLVSGFDLIADEVELYDRIEGADLVITAEGFLDAQSFEGKVVGGVAALAAEAGVPVVAMAGQVFDDAGERIEAISLVDRFGEERARADAVGVHRGGRGGGARRAVRRAGCPPVASPEMGERIRRAGAVAWACVGIAAVVALLGLHRLRRPRDLAAADPGRRHRLPPQPDRHAHPAAPHPPRGSATGPRLPRGRARRASSSVLLVAPLATDQYDDLADEWPELRQDLEDSIDDLSERSEEDDWPIKVPTYEELEDQFRGDEKADNDHDGVIAADERQDRFADQLDTARELALQVFHVGIIFVLAPIIAFYLLVDLPADPRGVPRRSCPSGARGDAMVVARRLSQAIGGYFRGQLGVALVVGMHVVDRHAHHRPAVLADRRAWSPGSST